MIRAFLDTNVLLDIELRRPVAYAPIKHAAIEGRLTALVSFGVLEEVRRVLDTDADLRDLAAASDRRSADIVREILTYTRFSGGFDFARRTLRQDPSDEPVLAAALAGEADLLVTRNPQDFEEAAHTIRIVAPEELLELIEVPPS